MDLNDIGYFVPNLNNKKSTPKQKIYAEGLLTQKEAEEAIRKLNSVNRQKMGLLEKDESKLLTDDGRELLI